MNQNYLFSNTDFQKLLRYLPTKLTDPNSSDRYPSQSRINNTLYILWALYASNMQSQSNWPKQLFYAEFEAVNDGVKVTSWQPAIDQLLKDHQIEPEDHQFPMQNQVIHTVIDKTLTSLSRLNDRTLTDFVTRDQCWQQAIHTSDHKLALPKIIADYQRQSQNLKEG